VRRTALVALSVLAVLAGCAKVPSGVAPGAAETPLSVAPSSRPVYRHSVLPGGVGSGEELAARLAADRVAAGHYGELAGKAGGARARTLEAGAYYISYRIGDKIFWTARPVRLGPEEKVLELAPGGELVRVRCGNRLSPRPMQPISAAEPAAEILDLIEVGDPPGGLRPTFFPPAPERKNTIFFLQDSGLDSMPLVTSVPWVPNVEFYVPVPVPVPVMVSPWLPLAPFEPLVPTSRVPALPPGGGGGGGGVPTAPTPVPEISTLQMVAAFVVVCWLRLKFFR
jgi:hypothetical protein